MHIWQLQEAKAKLTQLINNAKDEPQIISRRGNPESVVISIEKYRELSKTKNDIVAFFRDSPLYGSDIELSRDQGSMRDIEL